MTKDSTQKILIEIFIPSGKCTCSYSRWIDKIWDYIEDFREFVEVETLDTESLRANELGIRGQAVLVNGDKIPLFQLKTALNDLIKLFEFDNTILSGKTK